MRRLVPCLAILAAIAFAALPAAADDLTIVSKRTHDGGPPQTTTSYIGSDHARFAQPDGNDMLVDLKAGEMTVIDGKKKQYFVITHQDIQQMADKMREQMNSPEVKKAQEQMKNLPPEVQKKMQAMMGGISSSIDVHKMGTTRKVAGYTCENWTVSMGTMSKTEECVTNDLPFPVQTWNAYKEYADSMKSMMSAMGPMGKGMADMQEKFKEMKGFPLASTTTTSVLGHQSTSTNEVTEIRKGAIPASAWQIPAGYQKVESPMAKALAQPKHR